MSFTEEQMKQLQALMQSQQQTFERSLQQSQRSLQQRLDQSLQALHKRFDELDQQQGGLWESALRQSVATQFGSSFSKEFSIVSLQHLAKMLCRGAGWPKGDTPRDVCFFAEKLAQRLLADSSAQQLLRHICDSLTAAAGGKDEFASLGQHVKLKPWFNEDGNVSIPALGTSLGLLQGEEATHVKRKLEKLVQLERQPAEGRVEHLVACQSAGVMLAMYQSDPAAYPVQAAASFKDLKDSLPFLQLQFDIRGKLTIIDKHVTIEIGEIKRNVKQYGYAKLQLRRRARLLQWAVEAALGSGYSFVLIGHLFVPRGQSGRGVPSNEISDAVSIFTHQL